VANDGHEFSFSFSLDSCNYVQYTEHISSKETLMTSITIDLFFTVAASVSLFALLFASAFVLPWSEEEFTEVERDWSVLLAKIRGYSVAAISRAGVSWGRQPIGR
jgi:hypothetical protein